MTYEILYYGGSDSVVIAGSETHDDIAEVFHDGRHTVTQTVEQAMVTARLFAAAPDLLAALEKTTGFLQDFAFSCGGPQTQGEDDEWEAIRNARAAIAKTKGTEA